MKNKREIPLAVLRVIQPFLRLKNDLYNSVDPGTSMIRLEDNNKASNFFFEIESGAVENSTVYLTISYRPMNQNDPSTIKSKISVSNLQAILKGWEDRVKEYNEIEIYEDQLLKQYQEEFDIEVAEIIDEDSDEKSFNLEQQLWLDSYFDAIQLKLVDYKTSQNKENIEIIEQDIHSLKYNQSSMTKKQVISALTKIWSKVRKEGIDILKALYIEARSEIFKYLISTAVDKLH